MVDRSNGGVRSMPFGLPCSCPNLSIVLPYAPLWIDSEPAKSTRLDYRSGQSCGEDFMKVEVLMEAQKVLHWVLACRCCSAHPM